MKLKKGVQWVLEILATMSFIMLMITIESEWCVEYFLFVFINLSILVGAGFTLNKFGRWE